jgi:hypothetical protein
MPRSFRNCLVLILIPFLIFSNPNNVQAVRGIPGSQEFGIGATINPDGPFMVQALEMAADLELDWLVVPVAWAAYQPGEGQAPQFQSLDAIMQLAAQRQISVMVSLKEAPFWAKDPKGPDPARTADFVAALVERYPGAIQAVELFPGANVRAGWGTQPSAQAYTSLFQAVASRLRDAGSHVLLVAAGLRPLPARSMPGDLSDLEFLQQLYALGANAFMPVISMQYDDVTGDTLAFPGEPDQRYLRHYEEIRRVMVANHHQTGLIWITRFGPPSGKIDVADSVYHDQNMQSNWMSLAYIQLRAQLYIGVAIGPSLNPEREGTGADVPSLISGTGVYHPFYSVLHEMISLNRDGSVSIMPGKAKDGGLAKKRP